MIVLNDGRREYISAEAGDGAVAPPIATSTKVVEPAGWGEGITALDENNFDIKR